MLETSWPPFLDIPITIVYFNVKATSEKVEEDKADDEDEDEEDDEESPAAYDAAGGGERRRGGGQRILGWEKLDDNLSFLAGR